MYIKRCFKSTVTAAAAVLIALAISSSSAHAGTRALWLRSPEYGTCTHNFTKPAGGFACSVEEEETVTVCASWLPTISTTGDCDGYKSWRSMELIITDNPTGTSARHPSSGLLCGQQYVNQNFTSSGIVTSAWTTANASGGSPDLSTHT